MYFGGVAAAAAAAAATGYNPCPGSRPLANHVPRGCTNPFPTLTLMSRIEHIGEQRYLFCWPSAEIRSGQSDIFFKSIFGPFL